MARRALGPATLAAVQAVERVLVSEDRRLLVACSGGTDSTALAVAAVEAGRRRSLPVSAMVVDHGLQTGSGQVSAATLAMLNGLGLTDAEVVAVRVRRTSAGPEADARQARYDALERSAGERGATVLLGHTLDDQAETVLLGLARGSGLRSIAGMSVRRDRLLRPFLGLRRTATAAVCAEMGVRPWSDPHNSDRSFARVRVRTSVLPVLEGELGPGVAEALARTADLAREDADLLDQLAAAHLQGGNGDLECGPLADLPCALRRRVLRRWLDDHGVQDLAASHLRAVESLVTDWHGQRWIEVPGAAVRRVGGRLVLRT